MWLSLFALWSLNGWYLCIWSTRILRIISEWIMNFHSWSCWFLFSTSHHAFPSFSWCYCSSFIPSVAMVTVIFFLHLIYHQLTHLFVVFFSPLCPLCSVPIESVMSSSSHPGGARAPPGGWNRQHPARPGPAQTHCCHHDTIDHTWTIQHHVDNTNTITSAHTLFCKSLLSTQQDPQNWIWIWWTAAVDGSTVLTNQSHSHVWVS